MRATLLPLVTLTCVCWQMPAAAIDQTPPHSGGISPFRGEDPRNRGVRAAGLFFDECPIRIETGRPRIHRGDVVIPFVVINTGETPIEGYRVLAVTLAPDGAIRDRQPMEVARRLAPGKRHSTDITLHARPSPDDVVVIASERIARREAPCERSRQDVESAARDVLRELKMRR